MNRNWNAPSEETVRLRDECAAWTKTTCCSHFGWVYFVAELKRADNRVKIGKTKNANILSRVRSLADVSSGSLTLVAALRGAYFEDYIQSVFSRFRLYREIGLLLRDSLN